MSDTVVVLGNSTADGVTLFGKNSDRQPNEAHEVVRIPRLRHAPESMVKCTYIELPQVPNTHEVLLAKPFWMWGGEMGSNEFGVTIGNEAVFTKVPVSKKAGLLGTDLVRLGLERGKTAREAMDIIIRLLEEYGQGGNSGFTSPLYYQNTFIIADPNDVWVLETIDHFWAAQRVKNIRTISNGLTIHHDWDMLSPDIGYFAQEHKLLKKGEDFDFARVFSDPLRSALSNSSARQTRTTDLLTGRRGKITPQTLMSILRDHGASPKAYDPASGGMGGVLGHEVCMHAGYGPVRADQTTGSMVSHLDQDVQTHYVTGSAAPCTSIFKPVWLGGDLPYFGTPPTGTYDDSSLFWRHEMLHRATLRDYSERLNLYASDRDALETDFVHGAKALRKASRKKRAAYSAKCFADADRAEQLWMRRVMAAPEPAKQRSKTLYVRAWTKINTEAKLPDLARKTEPAPPQEQAFNDPLSAAGSEQAAATGE